MSAKADRLGRALISLEAALKANQIVHSKKPVSLEKERTLCAEVREVLVGNDFNTVYKEDRRYADMLAKAVELLFRMMNHQDQSARSYAEESLDAVLRSILLGFNHSRVLVLLITEVNRNGPARPLVAALIRLAQLIHLSKYNRIISYGVHIVNALANMLKRPEDVIQQAIVLHAPAIFDVLGPRLRDTHTDKAFELYRVAAENLDSPGSTNRAAFTVIAQVSTYYSSILQKAFVRCLMNIREADDTNGRVRLVGSMNTLKAIWGLIVDKSATFTEDNLKTCVCGVLCCVYSKHSEVIVAAMELLDRIVSNPLPMFPVFVPTDFAMRMSLESRLNLSDRSLVGDSTPASEVTSLRSSPLGSVLDLCSLNPETPFTSPLELPSGSDDNDTESSGSDTPPCGEEIIDPLMHSDLYDEVSRAAEITSPSPSLFSQPGSPPEDYFIPLQPPTGVCAPGSNFFVYAATTLGKRFLLAGLKGLKNDRQIRISHKILALNCIATISSNQNLNSVFVTFDDTEQSLSEVARFVLHDDDQLCASTIALLFAMDKWKTEHNGGNLSMYQRVVSSPQPIRKRALVQVAIGQQHLLNSIGLLENLIALTVSEIDSSFFLIRVTCAEFLSNINWSQLSFKTKRNWQEKCLEAYLELLFASDHKVQQAAIAGFPRLVRNADFTEYTNIFATGLPDEPLSYSAPIPAILNLSPEYRFLNESPDYVIESNLEVILQRLSFHITEDFENRSASFCYILNELTSEFPPTVYAEAWGCLNRLPSSSCGYLSTILDLCELSLGIPASLASGLNVLGALFGGQCESYMMMMIREQTSIDRSTLPRLPEPPVLDRILLVSLRVLNLYYSLVAEHRSAISQSSASILSRPSLSPLVNKKPSATRIADISRLIGTNVHPTKSSSYLESSSLNLICSSIQGAYVTYLEGLSPDKESKLISLLRAALGCLGAVTEMMKFTQLRPLLDEILLYMKIIYEIAPTESSRMLHQLFKVVFGKNAANINLDMLQAMKMKDPLPPANDVEMYFLRYSNEFTLFSAFIGKKEFVANYVSRELGWLKADMLSKIHNPPPAEIAPALELFEGFVTQLRHSYNTFQSVESKKAILGVMCELPRDGIIYSMADPKGVLLDAVKTQIQDPSNGNKEMLREIALFLIVLARTNVLKFDDVLKVATDLIEKVNVRNALEVLEGVRIILLEALFVQRVDIKSVYMAFQSKTAALLSFACEPTIHIWTLLLHATMNQEPQWSTVSTDFYVVFSDWLLRDGSSLTASFSCTVICLSTLAPASWNFDQLYELINACSLKDEDCSHDRHWKRIVPLLYMLFNNVNEQVVMAHSASQNETPSSWLNVLVLSAVQEGFDHLTDAHFPIDSFTMFLQMIADLYKTELYPTLRALLTVELLHCQLPQTRLSEYPSVFSQWMQLMTHCTKPECTPDAIPRLELSHCSRLVDVLFSKPTPYQNGRESIFRRATPEPEDCSLAVFLKSVVKSDVSQLSQQFYETLLTVESQHIYFIYEQVEVHHRKTFLLRTLAVLEDHLRRSSCNTDHYKSALGLCQDILDVISDVLDTDDSKDNNVELLLSVLSHVGQLCLRHHLKWKEIRSNELDTILECVPELMFTCDDVLEGLLFVLDSSAVREVFLREPLQFAIHIYKILSTTVEQLQRVSSVPIENVSAGEYFCITGADRSDLNDEYESFGGFELFLKSLFDKSHYIILIAQFHPQHLSANLHKMLRVLFRHPLLHSLAIVPTKALSMNWILRIDVRQHNVIHVPLVNIHLLCNLDVLTDFSWRISWLGWICRQQFKDFWMSLFGVLSSTPTGAEITADNSSNLWEQILSSSCAVSTLTDLLLYSLLFPEPGNVPNGTFIIKHREKTELFYQTKAMEQLRVLTSQLNGDAQPSSLFCRNMERLDYQGTVYNLGQLSALSLWTLTGDIKVEPAAKAGTISPRMRVSLSEFLLRTTGELDTASSVRALFENFAHWFGRGLDYLPLPLLSATVRSMTLLSDLFDEIQSYEFLYAQMKNVYRGGYLADHSDLGFVIYSLLKSVTVIGSESIERSMTDADVCKQIMTWVESGLTSRFPFVKEATLHGLLYLLQSMSLDSLRPLFQYVAGCLLDDISHQISVSDPIMIADVTSSFEYSSLMWAVAFKIMEQPLQVTFKNGLNQKLCEAFLSMNLSENLLQVITTGVEELIVLSASYAQQFLEVTLNCFKNYTSISTAFPFALRIFVVCVFRAVYPYQLRRSEAMRERSDRFLKPHHSPTQGAKRELTEAERSEGSVNESLTVNQAEAERAKAERSEGFASDFHERSDGYRRCDLRDGELISSVLPSILLRVWSEEKVLSTLLESLAMPHRVFPTNVQFTLNMMFELFDRLRRSERLSSLEELSRPVVSHADLLSGRSPEGKALATCLLLAAHPSMDTSARFYYYHSRLEDTHGWTSEFTWIRAKYAAQPSA